MPLTGEGLKAALPRWADGVDDAVPDLNALDGRLGDGDLGMTLGKCAANVRAALPTMPADLGGVLKTCAVACTKASGSSFGTLLAVACMTSAKVVGDRKALDWGDLPDLLGSVIEALSARGKASLGDKTVLDAIEAARTAMIGVNEPAVQLERALAAVDAAAAAFRDRPNKIGRARMFAERSIGLDDPGMVAFGLMVKSLRA